MPTINTIALYTDCKNWFNTILEQPVDIPIKTTLQKQSVRAIFENKLKTTFRQIHSKQFYSFRSPSQVNEYCVTWQTCGLHSENQWSKMATKNTKRMSAKGFFQCNTYKNNINITYKLTFSVLPLLLDSKGKPLPEVTHTTWADIIISTENYQYLAKIQ